MSGFLQRLVERHTAEPAVRPRAVSRYEGGGTDACAGGAEEAAAEAVADELRAAESRGISAETHGVARRDVAAPSRDDVRASDDETGPVFAEPAAPVAPSPRTAPETRAAALDDLPQVDVPRDAPRSAPDIESVASHDALPRRASRAEAPPPREPRPPQPAGPIVPRRAPTAARMNRAAPSPAALRLVADAPDREPDVVRVHIGRIEVRAVEAPADRAKSAPRAREETRPLSLDRYLAGGRRP